MKNRTKVLFTIFSCVWLNILISQSIYTDVKVSAGGTNQESENSVFIDPIDNTKLLISSNLSLINIPPTGVDGVNGAVSSDAGVTWTGTGTAIGQIVTSFIDNPVDPSAIIGLNGHYHIGYFTANGGELAVSTSTNNGNSWTNNVFTPFPTASYDKVHLMIDNQTPNLSLHSGNLYFGWDTRPDIYISVSNNNNSTWSAPINISSGVNATDKNHGLNIQTGPAGEVYAVWSVYDITSVAAAAIGFAKSTDGGATFSTAKRLPFNISGIFYNLSAAFTNKTGKNIRQRSFPSMAVDNSPTGNGEIYVVWANNGVPGTNTGNDVSIYMTMSVDLGFTWSNPIRINTDPIGNKQFSPWITCDPETGDLHVIFYDDRNVGGADLETWVATSLDAGSTWRDYKVSDVSFTPSGIPHPDHEPGYMGDYIGIAAKGGLVYPVWTDNREIDANGNPVANTYISPFETSCLPQLTISTNVSNSIDHQSAYETITASNLINGTSEVVYHAGNEVLMNDGFTVLPNSEYRAYIEACTGLYVKSNEYAPRIEKSDKAPVYFIQDKEHIKLIIKPNPTNGKFVLALSDGSLLESFEIRIYRSNLGLVHQNKLISNQINQLEINISNFDSGIYFIELIDFNSDNKYSGKVIKQ